MPDPEAPKPVGPASALDLTNLLMPWRDEQPTLVNVPGSDSLYLPLFSTKERLEQMMSLTGVAYDSIKLIQDGHEFASSIPGSIIIMVDPYSTPEGKMRWKELKRN